ncbi:MAG: nitroreductase family protein [Bacteroidetes bacterium]|nr:nitroreductase family protein [Bacteroidota bacterium]MBL6944329.1 nitroreductase family protein [Bacteroidales bacterium]
MLMDYFELINTRESVRDYDTNKKIEKEILLKIADAGRLAPSAANRQPWKFIIISSDHMLQQVRECYPKNWFKNAPHILVVVGDSSLSWVRTTDDYNSIETDVTIAMDHMILAAEAVKVATCWIAAFDNKVLREVLQLADNEVVYSITPLGYPNSGYQKKIEKIRKPLDEVVEFL